MHKQLALLTALIFALLPASSPASADVVLSGTFANGGSARVSVYHALTGNLVGSTFMDGSGNWSISLPEGQCLDTGYKVYTEAPSGYAPAWYGGVDVWTGLGIRARSWSEAACINSPSYLSMTLPTSGTIEGYVKDAATAADIDGAVVYAFTSWGQFTGWAVSGRAGSGRYRLPLVDGNYRLLVKPGAGYDNRWHDGAAGFGTATDIAAPGLANFSVSSNAQVQGYVIDAETGSDIDGATIYAWKTDGSYVGQSRSGASAPGRYELPLPPGDNYKLMVQAPKAHEDKWWDGAPGFVEATPISSPATASFSLRDGAEISVTATTYQVEESSFAFWGDYISAYTSCGCETPANANTGPNRLHFTLKVPSTAASGQTYKLRQRDSGIVTGQPSAVWFDGLDSFVTPTANAFLDAAEVSAPSAVAYHPDWESQAALRNALTAENVFYTDAMEFTDDLQVLGELENPLFVIFTNWPPTKGPLPEVRVQVTSSGGTPNSAVCLSAHSDSGTYWALADIMGGANSGIWYLENQSGDPLATCSEAIIVSNGTQAGWSA